MMEAVNTGDRDRVTRNEIASVVRAIDVRSNLFNPRAAVR